MAENSESDIPLIVDLDGTLIETDLLYEALILLLKKNPLYIFHCIFWSFKGKVYLKNKIFSIVSINHESLPYNAELLSFLKKENSRGRKLVLATASLKANASEISKVYSIFDEVYGTESINLKGKNKLDILIKNYGEANFDYIGNSNSDLVILASSRYSYLVNPNWSLERRARKKSNLKYIWNSKKGSLKTYANAARVYQWIKNLLLFVPLITSHTFHSVDSFFKLTLAFFAFNFVASAGYLCNDLSDLESDRLHPRKKYRALAAGNLPISSGIVLAVLFLIGGLAIAAEISLYFLAVVLVYFIISFLYSARLKKIAIYDVFILALLYSVRVYAGAIVINVALSYWLISFSTFMFLSLALVKRYAELMLIKKELTRQNKRREYSIEDLSLLQTMGIASGFLAIIVFSLYINSPEVALLYSKPKLLWTISLLFLFWITRIWHITNHGKMTDDPIIFAIKDVTSYCIFFIAGLILFLSI